MDRNHVAVHFDTLSALSLSARRAWIEIDWASVITAMTSVALRKESVDRNLYLSSFALVLVVALRKESVDRNKHAEPAGQVQGLSLSARRAWIEISIKKSTPAKPFVALRKESVDRNRKHAQGPLHRGASLSARRAWIEIFAVISLIYQQAVALRKESVDRNWNRRCQNNGSIVALRKESVDRNASTCFWRPWPWSSLSARRAWIEIVPHLPWLRH